jgi:hypothetical protein
VANWAGLIGAGSIIRTTAIAPTNNASSFLGTFIWTSFGAGPHPQQTYMVQFTVPGLAGWQGTRTFTPAIGVAMTVKIPVPKGADSIEVSASCTPGSTDLSQATDTWLYCNNDWPGQPPAPCCPPDATLQLQIDSILRMVTLLQRQLVPFAYISSTAHAGLTGSGSIAVQGLLGIRIDLTTIPTSNKQDSSFPPFVFDAGWVSMMDSNGFIVETRAHAQHQVFIPPIASDATVIGYSFGAGVVATITELQREP